MGDPTRDSEEHFTRVTRGANRTSMLGALAIQAFTVASVWPRPVAVGVIIAVAVATLPFNAWVTMVLLKKRGAVAAEIARTAFNIVSGLIVGHASGWPLAVFLWLPYVGLTFDGGFLAKTMWHTLVAVCAATSLGALVDGAGWQYPVAFTTLAIYARIIAEERLSLVRDMFRQSEAQRRALDGANVSLRLAQQRVERAAREQARVELELRNAQKLEAVGRLASGVAHEINTPLQFITNSVEFLDDCVRELTAPAPADPARAASLRAEIPDALRMAMDGLERVRAIVASLKEFAHPEQREKLDADLNHAVETTLIVARHEYKYVADVETHLGPIPRVRCHPGEINQVILNLIVNAAHAIGEIAHLREGNRGRIVISTARDGDEIVLRVTDDGAGIAPSVRHKIFEPFFTTKEVGRGTGQGLAIARAIVEGRHGGSLRFDSEPGRGTTFTMRLPIRGASRAPELGEKKAA